MKPIQVHPLSALVGAGVLGLALALTSMAQQISPPSPVPDGRTVRPPPPELKELLSHLSIVYLDDGQGGKAETIRFSGVNVQIVNGLGATNGAPTDPTSVNPGVTTTNGVGNLIVGYNEIGSTNDRTGSHNIVTGRANSYSSFGGLLAGSENRMSGPYASISGGQSNVVRAPYSSIHGGYANTIENLSTHAVISGGSYGLIHYGGAGATGSYSSICGGANGQVAAIASVVVGGDGNTCEYGSGSVVVGGSSNLTQGPDSVVVGGSVNQILENVGSGYDGVASVIVGGYLNTMSGSASTICGGYNNTVGGLAVRSVVCGGSNNAVADAAQNSVVGGGANRFVNGSDDWRAGDLFQEN